MTVKEFPYYDIGEDFPYYPINQHPHGEHTCYCPNCKYTMQVEAYQKCSEIICPSCGKDSMRAVETGEYRITQEAETPSFLHEFVYSVVAGAGLGVGFAIINAMVERARRA